MRVPVGMLILVAAIAAGIGYLLQPAPEPRVAVQPGSATQPAQGTATLAADASLDELRQAIEAESAKRQALARELAVLKKQLASLTTQEPGTRPVTEEGLPPGHQGVAAEAATETAWFNVQALVDAGIDTSVAQQIKQDFEALEMEKLYLRDRASREGWLRSPRFFEETGKLNARNENIRDQYGEDAYDAFLYATGSPNRVEVQSVLSSAPAGVAGIQAGDRILRYDNQRIYGGSELRDATAQGQAEEMVTVEVERDGQVLQFYLPRGPLGIRMSTISVAP